MLVRVLGREPDVEVDLKEVPVQPGDYVLLCSDGLTRMVPEYVMARAFHEFREPQRICDFLIAAANGQRRRGQHHRGGGGSDGRLVAPRLGTVGRDPQDEGSMPKLTLQFEGRLLKEYSVGVGLTIGRPPDNTVIIDNPAVSGHHARVFSESGAVILEDLNSTNGTFVNGQHTTRRVLRSGDVLLIGKHQLVFEHTKEWSAPPPALPALGDTVYLDTKQHRALRATLDETRGRRPARDRRRRRRPAPRRVGVLQVIAGRAEQTEYDLDAHTSLIGKSETRARAVCTAGSSRLSPWRSRAATTAMSPR